MKQITLVVGAVLVTSIETISGAWADAVPDVARQRELVRLVRQDCGACHGLRLSGGLGAPLLPETLRAKPADALKWTLLQGRPGTAMPAWQTIIGEGEAEWIVDRLQQGFPEDEGQGRR